MVKIGVRSNHGSGFSVGGGIGMGDLRSFAGGGGDGSVGDKSGIMVTFMEYLVRVVEVELVVVLE